MCLSVTTLAKASLGSTLRQRYLQHWYRVLNVHSAYKRGCTGTGNFLFSRFCKTVTGLLHKQNGGFTKTPQKAVVGS